MGKSVNQYETKTPQKAGGAEQTVDIERGIVNRLETIRKNLESWQILRCCLRSIQIKHTVCLKI